MGLAVFLVTSPSRRNLNVVISVNDRETAKELAQSVLGGNKDNYVVTPVTKRGTRTIFVTVTETVE